MGEGEEAEEDEGWEGARRSFRGLTKNLASWEANRETLILASDVSKKLYSSFAEEDFFINC